ncbi:MAG TPA: NrfD/PsrC family molybdoenzyme membrane anchor subunit [Candidatus Sulfotelmatobacter sp.]|nr:NrfD/PsrC family molybdoenzyme membrane anchor subunit [Candidatus Sulfotelmatobacter sp.]
MASSTPKATEERLQQIRQAAAEGHLHADSQTHPRIQGHDSYYGLPALKPPTWTWEVPLYFFLGGISGVSSSIALAAQIFGADPALIRLSLWIALVGAGICPALLIADLGRPSRFLNMLRMFKLQSPMSVGSWVLVAFSGCAFLSVLTNELVLHGHVFFALIGLRWIGEASAALVGLLLASYTGVLIGATAIPVWSQNRRLLPLHFLVSGLGGAAGILELAGFLIPATHFLGFVASGIETAAEILFEFRKSPADAPLHRGRAGFTFLISGILEGPAALGVRLLWGSTPTGREAAAICFLAGALLSRYAWIWAGRASAKLPDDQFAMQRRKLQSREPGVPSKPRVS